MKKEQEKVDLFFKKYVFKSKILTYILTILCFLFLVVTIVYTNNYSIEVSTNLYGEMSDALKNYRIWTILKDIMTVLTSIFGINLLLSECIERKNKDAAFEEFFVNDILYSPSFYDHLNEIEKKKILHNLEANVYFNNSELKKKMFKSIMDKLVKSRSQYLVENCKFNITCEVKDSFIQKEIIKKVTVKTIEGKNYIDKFPLLNVSSAKVDGLEAVELVYVKINGAEINKKKDVDMTKNKNQHNMQKKLGYNEIKSLTLKKKLNFNTKDAHNSIEMKYITRVPLNDLSYICRMSTPCKGFSLSFEMKNANSHRVNAYAFGFIDDGKDSLNSDDKSKVNIEFNDWIFPGDGVAISLNKL